MKFVTWVFLFGIMTSLWGGPVLKLSGASHNFGKFKANVKQEHQFTLTNTGDATLTIDQVKITCGCSAADVEKKELQPGESTSLHTRIKPESIEGPFSKGIFIHSNASNGRIQMVTLNGESLPLVKVLPQNMIFLGVLSLGKEHKQEFLLKTSEKVEFSQPTVTGELIPQVKMERISDTETKLVLIFIPSKAISRFKTTAVIKIDNPKGWKDLEITMQGDVK